MALFSKVNLYFLVYILSVSLVEAQRSCDANAFQLLRPCGNSNKYKELTGNTSGDYLNFQAAGHYCYANSVLKLNGWDQASSTCQTYGAVLAEFPRQRDWNDLMKYNENGEIFDTEDEFWVGGQYTRNKWHWYAKLSNVTEVNWGQARLPWARGEPNYTRAPPCMKMRRNEWYDTGCGLKQHFLCQLELTGAYNTKAELNAYTKKNLVTSPFFSGDLVNISCKARSSRGLKLVIVTPDLGNHTIKAGQGPNEIDNISVFNIVRDVFYFYHDWRCFRYDHFSLTINITRRVHESLVTCTHIEQAYDYLKSSLRITVPFLDRARVSNVKILPDVRWVDDKVHLAVGDSYDYHCPAYVGPNEKTSFAIAQEKHVWATSINLRGKMKAFGIRPHWFDLLNFKASAGNDDYEGGKYVNLTVSFQFIRPMDGASFGCYAHDITANMRGGPVILNKTDPLSTWIVFVDNEKFKNIYAMLEIANLTNAVIDGTEPISNCQVFHVTCTALGANRHFVAFKIYSGLEDIHEWKFGAPRKITRYASLTHIIGFKDAVYGPSSQLDIKMTVQRDMTTAKLECISANKDTGATDRHSRMLNLRPIVGSLPPKLTPERHRWSRTEFLNLTCESQIGDGDTQSWEILDDKGKINIVTIHKNSSFFGKTFPWLKIEIIKDPDACGQVIISKVTMLNLSPKEFGVTFTCYSYDVLSKNPVKSLFNKSELSATYRIFGDIKEEKTTEFLLYLLWFLLLAIAVIAISSCFWYITIGLQARQKAISAAESIRESMSMKTRSNVNDEDDDDDNDDDDIIDIGTWIDIDHGARKAKSEKSRAEHNTMSAVTGSDFTGATPKGESSQKSHQSGASAQ